MGKKMFTFSLQYYYKSLMKKGFVILKSYNKIRIKQFIIKTFFIKCRGRIKKLNDKICLLYEFRKYLNRKWVIKYIKQQVYELRQFDTKNDKLIKSFRIEYIKSVHRKFFKVLKDVIDYKWIRDNNKKFLKKKIFIFFFKRVCERITNKCKQRKKKRDIDEYYNNKLQLKFIRFLKLATNYSHEQRGENIRKYLIKKLFFRNMKLIYVIFK
jgi:hypothetical protein